ncbi:STM3941 family protein [Kitasatospora sp. NPDC004615]|uniref:STM3941 family protein n=1 Tax=Kitasatospora sp. NPDC004615 TaxID=3364017 RepID=UPI00368302C7
MIDKELAVPPPTVFLPRRGMVWRQPAAAAAVFVVSALVVAAQLTPILVLLGVIALPVSGLIVVIGLNTLIRRTPQLVMDAEGLTVPQLGRIHWDEIAGVRPSTAGTHEVILLTGHPGAPFPPRPPMLGRLAVRTNRRTGTREAIFTVAALPMDAKALIADMRRYHRGLTVLPSED